MALRRPPRPGALPTLCYFELAFKTCLRAQLPHRAAGLAHFNYTPLFHQLLEVLLDRDSADAEVFCGECHEVMGVGRDLV